MSRSIVALTVTDKDKICHEFPDGIILNFWITNNVVSLTNKYYGATYSRTMTYICLFSIVT